MKVTDGLWSVALRTVIEVKFKRGAGDQADPVRVVTGYFSDDGQCLAEHDPTLDAEQHLRELRAH